MSYQNQNSINYATILPLRSNNYITPSFDRNDLGPLNTPIKNKKNKNITKKDLNPVKKNLGIIFNFILEDLFQKENQKKNRNYLNQDIDSDYESDFEYEIE